MTSPTMKTCSLCGCRFGCGAQDPHGECWCAKLPHVMELKAGEDCYCPDCLKRKIEERIGKSTKLS